MKQSSLRLAALVLLAPLCGCVRITEFQIRPKPKAAELKGFASQESVYLEAFGDARTGIESGPLLAHWGFVDRQSFHSKAEEKGPLMIISMSERQEPKEILRTQFKVMLERAGLTVLEGDDKTTPGMARISGRIKSFIMDTGYAVAQTAFIRVEIDLELSLERQGKTLLKRILHGKQERRTHASMTTKPYETVVREAMEFTLDRAAEMLESKEFAAAFSGAAAAGGKADAGSIDEKLEKLSRMKKSGDLSEAEFKKAKAKLLEQ